MARGRRRTQWVDAILSDVTTIAGAAAPGTLVEQSIVTEVEMENIGGGATVIRIIGDIWTLQSAGAPVVTHTLYLRQEYQGVTSVSDWVNDAFQRTEVMATWMVALDSGSSQAHHTMVDIRSKRKLRQGISLLLSSQNHRIAGHDATYLFHLRCLLLLP